MERGNYLYMQHKTNTKKNHQRSYPLLIILSHHLDCESRYGRLEVWLLCIDHYSYIILRCKLHNDLMQMSEEWIYMSFVKEFGTAKKYLAYVVKPSHHVAEHLLLIISEGWDEWLPPSSANVWNAKKLRQQHFIVDQSTPGKQIYQPWHKTNFHIRSC